MSAKRLMWLVAGLALAAVGEVSAQVAIRANILWTMDKAGPIKNGVVIITGGKIASVGDDASTPIPPGYRVIEAAVATPGLIDARGTVGVSGLYNQSQDQDQLDRSGPMQPELRAIDAFNPLDPLVGWVRSLGVTTANTGHAPGELMSGQTCVVKLNGRPVDEAVLRETSAVTVTLGPWAEKSGKEAPGTRAKMVSMLRQELIKAREYAAKREKGEAAEESPEKEGERDKPKGRDLRLEQMARVLKGEVPLLITCNRSQDIAGALRLAEEFKIRVILDSASESYLLIDQIKRANVPVIIHPTMFRMFGEMQNMSLETASTLTKAGIPVAMQSGFEAYVPKTRVVLFEAAQAAANGLTFEQALATCTSNAADILGVADRVGRLRPGLDGDVALYDGDPFEWTSHCLGVVIDGRVYEQEPK